MLDAGWDFGVACFRSSLAATGRVETETGIPREVRSSVESNLLWLVITRLVCRSGERARIL